MNVLNRQVSRVVNYRAAHLHRPSSRPLPALARKREVPRPQGAAEFKERAKPSWQSRGPLPITYPQARLTAPPRMPKLGGGVSSMTWQSELNALIEETVAQVKAVGGANVKPAVPLKLVERALAESRRPAQLEPVAWSSAGSEREEITRRVANFRAVQERMQREREDYCDRTLSKARIVARESRPTT